MLLEEYAKCFIDESKRYKQDDLLNLSAILDENEEEEEES
jgi:hypothetical protein